jgi:hypothetical protein
MPSEDGNTYITFSNTTVYEVHVYYVYGPMEGRKPLFSVPVGQAISYPVAPSPDGVAFYFEYLIPVNDQVAIPYFHPDASRVIPVYAGDTNPQTVPALPPEVNSRSNYVVVESTVEGSSFWVQRGTTELHPQGKEDQWARDGESVYTLQDLDNLNLLTIHSGPEGVRLPDYPTANVRGEIYTIRYDGTGTALISVTHFNPDMIRKMWAIPTSTAAGKYLVMGKQKSRRNLSEGSIVLGTLRSGFNEHGSTKGYIALISEYGEVVQERLLTVQDNPSLYFTDVHETAAGNFIITYQGEYGRGTGNSTIRAFIMSVAKNGLTNWQLGLNDSVVGETSDRENLVFFPRVIVEKNASTFAVAGNVYDTATGGSATFVTEVQEESPVKAAFSWHRISPYRTLGEGDVWECRELIYTGDSYTAVELLRENGQDQGVYKVYSPADGALIQESSDGAFPGCGFCGIEAVGNKFYVFGEYQDVNGQYGALIMRFNQDMSEDNTFTRIIIPSNYGEPWFTSCIQDQNKILFGGVNALAGKREVPWVYAIDRKGTKLWENIYELATWNGTTWNDIRNARVWNLEQNYMGTLQMEIDLYGGQASLLVSTDIMGKIADAKKPSLPRQGDLEQ